MGKNLQLPFYFYVFILILCQKKASIGKLDENTDLKIKFAVWSLTHLTAGERADSNGIVFFYLVEFQLKVTWYNWAKFC